MGKKNKIQKIHGNRSYEGAEALLREMKVRDIQRACVVRGMDFEEVIISSIPTLSGFFVKNFHTKQDSTLLDKYDDFIQEKLKERGYKEGEPMLSPSLRLGYIGEISEETGEPIIKRIKGVKKLKANKRERDEDTKLFTGTKKALTYTLARKGLSVDEIFTQVKEKFPEAVEKSVKIWIKRSLKEAKEEKNSKIGMV